MAWKELICRMNDGEEIERNLVGSVPTPLKVSQVELEMWI